LTTDTDLLLADIDREFEAVIDSDGRHYLEIHLGKRAESMGLFELATIYTHAHAVIPLKHPVGGMKVRIDGRTFINYGQFASGMAVPAYVARNSTWRFDTYTPNDSMVLNFA